MNRRLDDDLKAMTDEREGADFPYIIFHFSFVIGEFKLEVQRRCPNRSRPLVSFTPGFSQVVTQRG
jgi:hypothetical protein